MNERQLDAIQTVVAMFNAAPGAQYLSEFVAFIDNSRTVKDLASTLAQTGIFKNLLYSDVLSNKEFSNQFVENTVGSLVSEENKSWAATEIERLLDAGETRGEVIHWAATALASVDPADASWMRGSAAI